MSMKTPSQGRCSQYVQLLNAVTALLVILDLPFALTAPMNIGMTEGAAGHFVLWAEVVGWLMMLYPFVAAAGVYWSVSFARAYRHAESLRCAIAPYGVAALLIVLLIIWWD